MSVFSNNLLLGAGGQSTGPAPFDPTAIGNSVWLDGSADTLAKTFSSGSAQTKVVISTWVQRNSFGTIQDIFSATGGTGGATRSNRIHFQTDDTIDIQIETSTIKTIIYSTTRVFRDIGWYHILLSIDQGETQGPAQVNLYVNGIAVTIAATVIDQGFSAALSSWGNAALHNVGTSGSTFLNGYQAQTTMLVGQSIQNGDVGVTDFLDSFTYGTNGSQFAPKKDSDVAALASTAGGNSFCLDFADSSDLGNDISSNNNDFTPTSMSSTNQSTNTPSLVYPKISNIGSPSGDAAANYTMGLGSNRMVYSGANQAAKGLISPTLIQSDDPKIYWEFYIEGGSVGGASGGRLGNGIAVPQFNNGTGNGFYGAGGESAFFYRGTMYDNGATSVAGFTTAPVGGIQQMAFEPSTGKVWIGVDGTWRNGAGTSGTTLDESNPDDQLTVQDYIFTMGAARSSDIGIMNFGDNPTMSGNITAGGNADGNGYGNFKYAVPSGFLAPNSANLTSPDYQGIDYFAPTLYQGNGTGQRVGDFVPFTDAFNVANSAMFQHDEARALSRTIGTPSSTGGKKGTWSTWYKTGVIDTDNVFFDTGTTATNRFSLQMDASGQIAFIYGATSILQTSADLKGGGLWRNLVLKVDTSLGTAADRAIMYIDGVEVTSFATDNRASLTQDGELGYMDSGATQFVGSYNGVTANQWDGYLAETIFLDDQFLSADSFGQLDTSTNKWVPKDISGLTLGDQGFYLAYGGNFGTGNGAGDSTGNSNNLTEIGTWSSADQFIDTPTKNFATLDPTYGYSNTTYTQGNLAVVGASVASQQNKSTYSTAFSKKSGKWWVEFDSILDAGTTTVFYGIIPTKYIRDGSFVAAAKDASTGYADNLKGSIRAYIVGSSYGNKVFDISIGTGSGVTSFTSGGIINNNAGGYTDLVPYGIALDMDNKKLWIGNPTISATTWNNETSVSPAANTGGFDLEFDEYSIFISNNLGTSFINYGQYVGSWNGNSVTDHTSTAGGNFTLAPPTDFKAINQDNLDDTASKLTAFSWIKNRDATDSHILVDRVRGVGEVLHSNELAAEATEPNTVQRFLQRGVQVGSDVQVNTANEAYVLWQWLIGDSATTGTVNNDGSIPSTIIAADAGNFSVGTYTGQTAAGTVGHGLGGAAEMVIVWDKGFANSIAVYHAGVASDAATDYLLLNSTDAATDDATFWNDTAPTASVFSVGTGNNTNGNTRPKSFLAFRSVAGVCKVGSYTGNSDDDGTYLSLGFKPAWWMVKCSSFPDASHDWFVADSARYTFNGTTTAGGLNGGTLEANDNTVEEAHSTNFSDNPAFDFLSDGIKLRTNSGAINATGRTYIYLAMADIGGNGTLPPVYGR